MQLTDSTKAVRIVLVDDHDMVRQALASVIHGDARFEVVGEASDRRQAVDMILALEPSLVVLDFNMPDGGAPAVMEDLRRLGARTRVLILTVHDSVHYAAQVLEAGADGFLIKTAAVEELKSAILSVNDGQVYISREIAAPTIDLLRKPRSHRIGAASLSARELELLRALGRGRSMKEAASLLNVCSSTVSTYRARIMKKLGMKRTSDLIRFALENGLG